MMNVRQSLAVLAIAAVVWFAPSGAAQSPERYKVRLTTVPMDGGMRNTVAGSGSATATLTGNALVINGTFDGLRSPAVTARVHSGVARGVRGALVAELAVTKAVKGALAGSVNLTPDQVKGLREGRLYIELASEKAPEGNLWGWILK